MNPIGSVEPEAVATNVMAGIRARRPYAYTDEHHIVEVEERLGSILSARADVLPPADPFDLHDRGR